MQKYAEIQQLLSCYAMQFPEWRIIRRFTVNLYNYAYNIAVVEKEHLLNGTSWELYYILFPDINEDCDPVCIPLREYYTLDRANIAFTALTKL